MKNITKVSVTAFVSILILFSSLSASAITHSCSVGVVDPPGAEYWPRTVYHRTDFTTADAVYGVIGAYGWLSSPMSQGGTDLFSISGAGAYTQYAPSPFPGVWIWGGTSDVYNVFLEWIYGTGSCSGSVTFTAPTVDVYSIPSSAVVKVGDSVTLGFTASTGDGNACTFEGVPQPIPSSVGFTAALSDAGNYNVTCTNYFAQASDSVDLVVIDCAADPGTTLFINYSLTVGSNTNPFGKFDEETFLHGFGAYCSGNEWKLRVTSASQVLKIDINFGSVIQISTSGINSASCSELTSMKNSLISFSSSISGGSGSWHAYDAVYNHEQVHKSQYTALFDSHYNSFRSDVESLSIPLSNATTAIAAHTQLATLADGFMSDIANDSITAHNATAGHVPESAFIAAQQSGSQPFIAQIDTRLANCP